MADNNKRKKKPKKQPKMDAMDEIKIVKTKSKIAVSTITNIYATDIDLNKQENSNDETGDVTAQHTDSHNILKFNQQHYRNLIQQGATERAQKYLDDYNKIKHINKNKDSTTIQVTINDTTTTLPRHNTIKTQTINEENIPKQQQKIDNTEEKELTKKEKNLRKKAMKAERKQQQPITIKGNKYEKTLTPKSRQEAGVKIERDTETIYSNTLTQETQITCAQRQQTNTLVNTNENEIKNEQQFKYLQNWDNQTEKDIDNSFKEQIATNDENKLICGQNYNNINIIQKEKDEKENKKFEDMFESSLAKIEEQNIKKQKQETLGNILIEENLPILQNIIKELHVETITKKKNTKEQGNKQKHTATKETTENTEQKEQETKDTNTQQQETIQNIHEHNNTQLQETINNTQDNSTQPIIIIDESQDDSNIHFNKHSNEDLLLTTNQYIKHKQNEQENKTNHKQHDNIKDNIDLKQYTPNKKDQISIEDRYEWDDTDNKLHNRPPLQRKNTNDMDQTVTDTELTNRQHVKHIKPRLTKTQSDQKESEDSVNEDNYTKETKQLKRKNEIYHIKNEHKIIEEQYRKYKTRTERNTIHHKYLQERQNKEEQTSQPINTTTTDSSQEHTTEVNIEITQKTQTTNTTTENTTEDIAITNDSHKPNTTKLDKDNIKNSNIPTTNKPKQKIAQPIIVDNMTSKYNKEQLVKKLHETFNKIPFTTRHLKQGGIAITPTVTEDLPKHTNTLLNKDNYPTNIFGQHLYIHLSNDNDLRPWLCLNKVDYDITMDEISQKLNEHYIQHEGLHRKLNGTLPTTLILFKVTNKHQHDLIINKKLPINKQISTIRQHINISTIRCTHCQKLGHIRRLCPNPRRCVRCAGENCLPQACQNGTKRICVNCGGDHASSYKNCKHIKSYNKGQFEFAKQQSYTQILTNKQTTIQEQQKQQHQQIEAIQNTQQNTTNIQETIDNLKTKYDELTNEHNKILTEHAQIITLFTTHKQINIKMNETINTLQQEIEELKEQKSIHSTPNKIQDIIESLKQEMKANNDNNKIQLAALSKDNNNLKQQIKQHKQQNNTNQNKNTNNNKLVQKIHEQSEDIDEHINTTMTRILKDITIPLIYKTIIDAKTIDTPKVLQRRIMENLQTLIHQHGDIPLDLNELRSTDNESSSASSVTSSPESNNEQKLRNNND